jgi:quinol monooxygenase YgiN
MPKRIYAYCSPDFWFAVSAVSLAMGIWLEVFSRVPGTYRRRSRFCTDGFFAGREQAQLRNRLFGITIQLNCTPKDIPMPQTVLSVKIKCQPGKRDDVKELWETMTKPHAAESENVQFSCYAFADQDPDTIILFEVLASGEILTSLYQEEWFKEYLAKMGPLLAGPPEVLTGTPVWIK